MHKSVNIFTLTILNGQTFLRHLFNIYILIAKKVVKYILCVHRSHVNLNTMFILVTKIVISLN